MKISIRGYTYNPHFTNFTKLLGAEYQTDSLRPLSVVECEDRQQAIEILLKANEILWFNGYISDERKEINKESIRRGYIYMKGAHAIIDRQPKIEPMATIKATANKTKRTFTIRTEVAKYRTGVMSKAEFEAAQDWTNQDWKNYLNTSQDYSVVK